MTAPALSPDTSGRRIVALFERPKYPFQVRFLQPDAAVANRNLQTLPVQVPGLQLHGPAFGSELDGIGEEVVQDLLDLSFIRPEGGGDVIEKRAQLQPALQGLFLDHHQAVLQDLPERDGRAFQFHLSGFDL